MVVEGIMMALGFGSLAGALATNMNARRKVQESTGILRQANAAYAQAITERQETKRLLEMLGDLGMPRQSDSREEQEPK